MTQGSRISDYDYALPPDRIAQTPSEKRDESRLMLIHRQDGRIEHKRFHDLPSLIPPNDGIVLNTTRVYRARLLGTRDSGAPAELLLLKPLGDGRYEAMVHPGGKLKPGRRVHVSPDLEVEILESTERRTRIVRLRSTLPVDDAIERYGHTPLPPYIDRPDEATDVDRYQTVYADVTGSVAAPTAGLHFTDETLAALEQRGVRRADVLLHVGAGTFKPVEVDDPAEHVMHEETFTLPARAAATLNDVRQSGGSIWAVGTTSVRVLETAVQLDGTFKERSGETQIFIRPPYRFRAVDRLITNFHLPRSTLIMLVAAFAGYELTMTAYRAAIQDGYRFYSYGDAMAII
ncbi:MAG TPA: tRNA preQ1(34) S-adenosylmethionine ribosyltransferase-isomerase QueA [Gemmatimonadaceae bacterium]|nr:tRNA preQ1(34) S-adenosylmethionine ribosyltransferase-isomerase QueA [Gemmatimonadaceae bacterium]